MTHPTHGRVNTCAHVCTELTHALSRKVLSLTELKGKIYKTKSLGHYITQLKETDFLSCNLPCVVISGSLKEFIQLLLFFFPFSFPCCC